MDFLTGHAQNLGDKVAVVDDRPGEPVRSLTFAAFNDYVNQIANGWIAAGVSAGEKLLWCGMNSLEVVAITHAARKLGVVSVPLNYRLTDEESAYVVDNSDATMAWIDADYADLFHRISAATPKLRTVVVFGESNHLAEGQIAEADFLGDVTEPDAAADPISQSMIYTSGTTGKPKGAVRRSGGSPEQALGLFQMLGYEPGDVYITCGPLYHSGPGGFAGFAHQVGNTIVLQYKFDAEDWMRLIDTYSASSTFSAPTPIRMVTNLPTETKARYDVTSMKVLIANAAPWSFALKQAYVQDFPPESLWEIYGSTEMGVNTVLAPEDQMRKPGSCGKPAPHVECMLFDEQRRPVTEPGVPGELWVRASSVFETYHKASEKYAEEHTDDGFHTVGDMAYWDDEGYLYICDRKKDMIISGGMNIYPAEIESALEEHPAIYEAAVFGIPSDDWGESVHACIVRNDDSLDAAAVTAFCREHLAGYKVPRSIDFLAEIPKTGSNKILKRQLRAPYWADHATGVL